MANLLEFDAALALLGKIPKTKLGTETIAADQALGRILAQPIAAPCDIPRFDNSAADGYAVATLPALGEKFSLIGESSAGEPFAGHIKPAQAVRIATGAVLPEGTVAIIMQEHCRVVGNQIVADIALESGANCRRAGQDVCAGALVLPENKKLSVADLAMLAALGIAAVTAKKKLRIAIASTGNELVEIGNALPAPGQTYDSNRPLLKAMLAAYPVEIIDLGILPDDEEITRVRLLDAAANADLIVTTGGVSVGPRDYVRETIKIHGEIIFWRVAIKPGKPLLLGKLGQTPLLGLPGNPVSTFVTFSLVGRVLLYRLLDAACPAPLRIPVRAGFTYQKSAILREFLRVSVTHDDTGLTAMPFRSQLSNLISSLLESDGILDLPAGRHTIEPGEVFNFIPWTSTVS